MNNRLTLFVFILLAVIGTALFFALFESYEETVDKGWSSKAYSNYFLAAEEFLKRTGKSADTFYKLSDTLPLNDVNALIIDDGNLVINGYDQRQILSWVESGGQLILFAPLSSGNLEAGTLLHALDITVDRTDYSSRECTEPEEEESNTEENPELQEAEPLDWQINDDAPSDLAESLAEQDDEYNWDDENCEDVDEERTLTRLEFSHVAETIEVRLSPYYTLMHPALEESASYNSWQPDYWQGTEWGVHYMEFVAGEGVISVMSNDSIWENYNIQEHDNAFLLHVLTQDADTVAIVLDRGAASLWELMWRYGTELMVSLILWLLMWMVYRARRFLPPVETQYTVRRSLVEHLQAVASFWWQHKKMERLLNPMRADIKYKASFYITGFVNLSQAEQYQALAEIANLPIEQVAQCMSGTDITSEVTFTNTVKTLQIIQFNLH